MKLLPVIADPSCTRCGLHATTDRVCALSPPKRADIMVIGEAPGRNEEKSGLLFSGQAGRILWDALADAGIMRDDVYVANAVSCRPPNNKTPTKREIRACNHWVKRQIEVVKPKFVLLLGNVPLESITGKKGIRAAAGKPIEQDGVIYLPCYHPASILYDERNLPPFKATIELFAEVVKHGKVPEEEGLNWTIVDTDIKLQEMLNDLRGTVSYDLETRGSVGKGKKASPYPWVEGASVQSIGFGTRNRQWCLPLNHPESPWPVERHAGIIKLIGKRLKHCYLVTHSKFDPLWMKVHYEVNWRVDFDTLLAHYLVDENSKHGLKMLAQVYFGAPNYDVDRDDKHGAGPLYKHCKYLAHDVYYTRKLRFALGKQLAADGGIQQVFDHILMPAARLFVDIEYNGVQVDVAKMAEVEVELRKTVAEEEKALNGWCTDNSYDVINWGSSKQLAAFFFETLGLTPLDRTKSGKAWSTSESVLLRLEHPVVDHLLKWKAAKKNLSMFIDGWKPFLDKNGRLHPSFKLHGTVTGRPSCEHPNLQQVPRESLIRALIVAAEGYELLDGDLSQIELRISAELSGDEEMLGAFDRGEDVHWLTATREIGRGGGMKKEVLSTVKQWLMAHPDERSALERRTRTRAKDISYGDAIHLLYKMGPDAAVAIWPGWKESRKKAKAINFGYLYGMWWKKFKIYARDNYGVKVTDEQAKESREAFFSLYKQLAVWHARVRKYARRFGEVRSMSGRLRRVPNAMRIPRTEKEKAERGEAERQAINSPVQGFASDLNLMVLLQLVKEFGLRIIRPVGTVHDAILMEVKRPWVSRVAKRMLEIMTGPELFQVLAIKLRVPLMGEVKVGPWSKGIDVDKWAKQQEMAS